MFSSMATVGLYRGGFILLKKKPCVVAGLVAAMGLGIALNGPIVANAQDVSDAGTGSVAVSKAGEVLQTEASVISQDESVYSENSATTKDGTEQSDSSFGESTDDDSSKDTSNLVDPSIEVNGDVNPSNSADSGENADDSDGLDKSHESDSSSNEINADDAADSLLDNESKSGNTSEASLSKEGDSLTMEESAEELKPKSAGWYLDEKTGAYYWSEDGAEFYKNRWGYINGNWYWFDEKGVMATGVASVADQTYHFRENGGLQGAMYTEWSQDVADNSWYYSNYSGFLLRQWQYIGGAWYWFDPDTFKMKTGWLELGTKEDSTSTYYLTDSGAMATGWIAQGSDWYYADNSGALASGWRNVGGSWYYMDSASEGYKMKTGWLDLSVSRYYLSTSGAMATGWIAQSADWYWADGSGALAKGWRYVNGSWYYLNNEDYKMLKSLQTIGSTRYFFNNSSGAMAENSWGLDSDGSWYWGTASGALAKGWVVVNGTWYYMDGQSNKMTTGYVKNINGASYFFNNSGAMAQNGWGYSSDGSWYWANSSGALASGWIVVNGSWYFLDPQSKKMVANDWRAYSNGSYYYLGSSGAMAANSLVRSADGVFYVDGSGASSETGWKTIGGNWYYFDTATDAKGRHAAKIGFAKINGNAYYFGTDAAMVSNQWVVYDGSLDYKEAKDFLVYAQASGVISLKVYADVQDRLYRWNETTKQFELMFDDGKEHEFTFDDGGAIYCVDQNGSLVFGWHDFTDGGKTGTKYYSHSGLRKGLFSLDDDAGGKIYYADSDGYILKNNPGKVTYNGKVYYVDAQSVIQTGWKNLSGVRGFDNGYHYFGSDGAMRTNWLLLDSNWYWLQSNGVMVSNAWAQVGGEWYWLQSNGAMKVGWLEIDGARWFFLGSSGAMATGWLKQGGTWYYLSQWSNFKSYDYDKGITSMVHELGQMITGWLDLGTWYFFSRTNGWDGYSLGAMVTGVHEVDGNREYFDNAGGWVSDMGAMLNRIWSWSSGTQYLILLDSASYRTFIFQGSAYNWKPLYVWSCGVWMSGYGPELHHYDSYGWYNDYTVGGDNACYNYTRWKDGRNSFKGGYRTDYYPEDDIKWFTGICLDLGFHSTIGWEGGYSDPSQLRVNVSHGCVRLLESNAKWIYDNCGIGTRVRFA